MGPFFSIGNTSKRTARLKFSRRFSAMFKKRADKTFVICREFIFEYIFEYLYFLVFFIQVTTWRKRDVKFFTGNFKGFEKNQ